MRLIARALQVVIWIIIGPVAAAAIALALFGADVSAGAILAAVPPAMLLGAMPAGIAGLIDRSMTRSRVAPLRRFVITVAIATAASAMIVAPAYLIAGAHGPYPLLLVLAGSLGAAVAWGLSNGLRRVTPPARRR